jgi:hypothetical protein
MTAAPTMHAAPSAAPNRTSVKKCIPRYILEMATMIGIEAAMSVAIALGKRQCVVQ